MKINEIEKTVFVRVHYHRIPQEPVEVYLPIVGYYNVTHRTGYTTGEIEYSYGAEYLQNHGSYYKVYKKAIDYTKKHNADQEIVLVDLIKVFKIDYEDIYNEQHEVYFINGNLSTHGDVEEINRNVEAHFPNEWFKIGNINFDEVLRKIVDGGSQSD